MYKNYSKKYAYKPCRIIYYNSGRYTFFETNLDKNTILFGNNNAGKTSFLNGLQFFLLPEINLRKLHEKFHFAQKHDSAETYKYYFPEKNSFIIAEFENPFGKFLQIIFSGGNELEYHRIFTKATYEEVKNHFWDYKNNQVKEIDSNEFKAYLKTTENYKYVKTIDSIVDLIYSNDLNNEDRGRYSIVPTNSKYDSIRNIIKLAFNIDVINEEDLKEIIINYIESNLKSKKDVVDFDFNKLCDQQNLYKEELAHFSVIKNHTSLYERCHKNINILKELGPKIKKTHVDFYLLNENLKVKYKQEIEILIKEIEDLEKKHLISKEEYSKAEKEYTKQTTSLYNTQVMLNGKEDKYKNYLKTLSEHKLEGKSEIECFTYFENLIKSIDNDLLIIEDKNKIENEIQKIKTKIKKLTTENEERASLIENSQDKNIVYNQLEEKDSILLRILFPTYAKTKYTLSEKEKSAISALKDLVYYNNSNDSYYLFNKKLDKFEEKINIENEKLIIEENKSLIEKLNKELSDKNSLLTGEISKNKDKLIYDKSKLTNSYTILKTYNCVLDIEELKKEIEEIQKKIVDATKLRDSTKDSAINDNNAYITKENLLKQLKKDQEEHKNLYQEVQMLTEQLGVSVEMTEESVLSPHLTKLTKEAVDLFCKELKDSKTAKKEIRDDLIKFVDAGIIDDDDKLIIQSEMKAKDMFSIFNNKLVDIYENLEDRIKSVEMLMLSGFNDAYSAAENISEYRRHVLESMNEFNKDLIGVNVSNFSHISLKTNFNMRFDDFSSNFKNIDNHNPTEESMTTFFLKLRQLLDEIGLVEKLTLSKIIKGFTIKFHNIDGTVESSVQSNGTGIMANAVILSQLKNSLIKGGKNNSIFNYQIPIIIDEVSNIDNKNLKVLKNFLNDKDLIMFCATPTPSINADNNYESVIYLSTSLNNRIFSEKRPVVHCLPEDVLIKGIDNYEESYGEYKEGN